MTAHRVWAGLRPEGREVAAYDELGVLALGKGILEGDGGPTGLLLVTDDHGGVKEYEWETAFLEAFGASVSIRPLSTARRCKPQ